METVLPWHQLLAFLEGLQEPTQPSACSIPLQCDMKAVLVHNVIGLPKVQEYQEEGVLVYSSEFLGKI